jgi:hypothetical protein
MHRSLDGAIKCPARAPEPGAVAGAKCSCVCTCGCSCTMEDMAFGAGSSKIQGQSSQLLAALYSPERFG